MSVRQSSRCEAITAAGTQCKNRTAHSELCWIHLKSKYKLRIKKSKIPAAGLGLYTTAPLRSGTRLPYKGRIVTNLPDGERHDYALQIRRHPPTYINPVYTNDGFGQYANSCKTSDRRARSCPGNNAHLRPSPGLRANIKLTRNIGKDKEIYVAYGRDYWR
jgi:hypothetical protein